MSLPGMSIYIASNDQIRSEPESRIAMNNQLSKTIHFICGDVWRSGDGIRGSLSHNPSLNIHLSMKMLLVDNSSVFHKHNCIKLVFA
jgi:hypothetical protein